MTIETGVYIRKLLAREEAGKRAVAETMKETVRFGNFRASYIDECAGDRYKAILAQEEAKLLEP